MNFKMRVRFVFAVIAVWWPLLATAAPALAPVNVPACCRRDGPHHCMLRSNTTGASVREVCPFGRQHQRAMATHWARPAAASADFQAAQASGVPRISLRTFDTRCPLLLSSRAPPELFS